MQEDDETEEESEDFTKAIKKATARRPSPSRSPAPAPKAKAKAAPTKQTQKQKQKQVEEDDDSDDSDDDQVEDFSEAIKNVTARKPVAAPSHSPSPPPRAFECRIRCCLRSRHI